MNRDKELDDYLKGGSEVSRAYADAHDIQVPGHLDAAILAEAHRAVYARPTVMPKRRWAVPLGMVATVFIMVIAGLQLPAMMKDDALMQAPQMAMERNMPLPASVAPERVQKTEPKQIASARKAESEQLHSAPRQVIVEAYAQRDAATAAESVAAPPVRNAPIISANEVSGVREERLAAGLASGEVADTLSAPARIAAAPAPVMAGQLRKEKALTLNPEDWLKHIKELQQAGKLEEAKKELAAFKKRYPDHPIPKSINMH